jgi:branched-chain amino acid transport system permease protein
VFDNPSNVLGRLYLPCVLVAGLGVIVLLCTLLGGDQIAVSLTEMLIRLIVVVGLYMFVGNSGILSFGHIAFMGIGAYAAAWATCDPEWKGMMLTGLPMILQEHQYPFLVAVVFACLLAAAVAFVFGLIILRLSGIAASISTFAFLVVINSVTANWDTVTGGTSSVVNIPTVVGPWTAFIFAAVAILAAALLQTSSVGLMLRASRDDEVAAKASGIGITQLRLLAFVLSGLFVGLAGALYAQFLGILTADIFYITLTFVAVTMLVVGGVGSLTGAVVGVVVITAVTETLRAGEAGFHLGSLALALPRGTQEIGLGVIMALALIFRPSGLTGSREVPLPSGARGAGAAALPANAVEPRGVGPR